jgi:UDP-glucose 4-epimerase
VGSGRPTRLLRTERHPIRGVRRLAHLAMLSLVGDSVGHPRLCYRTNVCGTLNLLDTIGAVYGKPAEVSVEETAPSTNPYGSSKLAADGMIGYEPAAGGLAAVSLRYLNVAGTSAAGRSGGAQLVPTALRLPAGGEERVEVFGTDYPTPERTARQEPTRSTTLETDLAAR